MPHVPEERLQKALARLGLASRREAEDWIRAGRLTVNGALAHLGMRIRHGDQIRLDGRLVRQRAPSSTHVFLYHRSPGDRLREPAASDDRGPGAARSHADDWRAAEKQAAGAVPATDEFSRGVEPAMFEEPAHVEERVSSGQGHETKGPSNVQWRAPVQDRLPKRAGRRFIPISPMPNIDGGLELLSSDGELAEKLQRSVRTLQSEFSVRVHGELGDDQRRQIREGVLDRGVLEVLSLDSGGGESSNRWYTIQTRGASGKDVRQLFERQGAIVSRILRTRLGTVNLGRELARGQFRKLTDEELEALVSAASQDSTSAGADDARESHVDSDVPQRPARGPYGGDAVPRRGRERDTRAPRSREDRRRQLSSQRFEDQESGEDAPRGDVSGEIADQTANDPNTASQDEASGGSGDEMPSRAPNRGDRPAPGSRRVGNQRSNARRADTDSRSPPFRRSGRSATPSERDQSGRTGGESRRGERRDNFSSVRTNRPTRDSNAPRRYRDQSARGERPTDGSTDFPPPSRRSDSPRDFDPSRPRRSDSPRGPRSAPDSDRSSEGGRRNARSRYNSAPTRSDLSSRRDPSARDEGSSRRGPRAPGEGPTRFGTPTRNEPSSRRDRPARDERSPRRNSPGGDERSSRRGPPRASGEGSTRFGARTRNEPSSHRDRPAGSERSSRRNSLGGDERSSRRGPSSVSERSTGYAAPTRIEFSSRRDPSARNEGSSRRGPRAPGEGPARFGARTRNEPSSRRNSSVGDERSSRRGSAGSEGSARYGAPGRGGRASGRADKSRSGGLPQRSGRGKPSRGRPR